MITRSIHLPEGSRYCQVSALAYALQRGLPSPRAGFTPRSRPCQHDMFRNLYRMSITCPSRVPLSSRLTLIRLTLFRKPWVFGAGVSPPVIVTYAYIFFSGRSSNPHGITFYAVRNAPLPLQLSLQSMASAAVLMPAHHPRNAARLVSCYALFE